MDTSDTPLDHTNSSASAEENTTASSGEINTESTTSRSVVGSPSSPSETTQSTSLSKPTLPRRLRRRAARDKAKRMKQSHRNGSRAPNADPALSDKLLKIERDYLLNQLNIEYRKFRLVEASTRPEAVIDPGLVIVRGEGASNDDALISSVIDRVYNYGRVAICILDHDVYDTLPIVYRDPLQELRESPLTGASASDEVFVTTTIFYNTAHSTGPKDRPVLPDDHQRELVRQVREVSDGHAWKYPLDTPPLSTLAQRVLLHLLHLALNANKATTLETCRYMVGHGRFLELIDPRDGPV
jgi:hypothetical protein